MKLQGLVTADGQPVEGAYVRLIGPSGDFTAEVRTNQSGQFTFYPRAGRWQVRALLPGGANLQRSVAIDDGATVEMELTAEDRVTGGVGDAAGAAPPG